VFRNSNNTRARHSHNILEKKLVLSLISVSMAALIIVLAPGNAKADDAVTHQLERNIGKLYDLGELYNRKLPKNSTTISSSAALHDLYYLQPHNTFDHDASLTAWLNSGYRSLELDVIDRGDWEKETKGPYVSHNFEAEKNNCKRDGKARLGDCFQQIKDWIDRNGTDVPIMLYIDMKASWDPASAWKSDEMAQLNRWIGNSILGDYLFTYKDLADHIEAKSRDRMRVNLRGRGWPLIASMRNKVVVVLTGGPRGNVNDTMGKAVWKHSTLANMFVFFCPDVDAQDEKEISGNIDSMSSRESKAFVCANIEMADHAEDTLNRSVEWNQLNHIWDASGDFSNKDFSYLYMATSNGANAISIDIKSISAYKTGIGSLPLVGYRGNTPAYFNMVTDDGGCLEATGANNGAKVITLPCDGRNFQKWHYTAEGQIRPRNKGSLCLDIDGGDAKNGKQVHLWDCDGGNSEKWYIRHNGQIASRDNQTYCIVPGPNPNSKGRHGPRLRVCGTDSVGEQIKLRKVKFWLDNNN